MCLERCAAPRRPRRRPRWPENSSSTSRCICLDAPHVDARRARRGRRRGARGARARPRRAARRGRWRRRRRARTRSGSRSRPASRSRSASSADAAAALDQVGERVGDRALAGEDAVDELGPVGLEQGPDRGEREAPGLEVADLGEAVEVVLAVDLGPAGPGGRGEQALALVEADGVDGQARPAGQLVDADLGHRSCSSSVARPDPPCDSGHKD